MGSTYKTGIVAKIFTLWGWYNLISVKLKVLQLGT